MDRTKLTALLALPVLGLALAIGGCGDDDDDEGGGGGTTDAATLEVEAADDGLVAPESVEAGLTEIVLTNSGKQDHEAQLLRIEGNHTAEEAVKVVTGNAQKIPDWIVGGGGVGTASPGQTRTATQVLEPGTYAIIDTDARKPQSAEFEVTGEAAEADLPDAPATVTASEYTFESSGLKAGENTILFENTGQELHHVIANPVKQDATAEQIAKFFQSGEKGPNPFKGGEEAGVGTSVLDGGVSQVTDLELEPGRHAFMCFIPDRAGGPPHAFKGMITIETVE